MASITGRPYDFDFITDRTRLIIEGDGPSENLVTNNFEFQDVIARSFLAQHELYVIYDNLTFEITKVDFGTTISNPAKHPEHDDWTVLSVTKPAPGTKSVNATLARSGNSTKITADVNAYHILRIAETTGEPLLYADLDRSGNLNRCKINR